MGRGGKRPGAGRPPGSVAKAKSMLDQAKTQAALNVHIPTAILALVDVATNGKSESARVSAAAEILNRAIGRPASAFELDALGGAILTAMMEASQEELDEAGIGFINQIPLPNILDER